MKMSQYFKKFTWYTFEWFREHLITKNELQVILVHINEREKEINRDRNLLYKRIVTLLYSLGIILILAGVVYFIAANWRGFHKFLKLSIILAGMGLFYGTGYITQKRFPDYNLLNKLLTFCGTFFFGIALALAGQIYNSHANSYTLFFIWFLPSIISAYITGFEPYYTLSAILLNLSIWFFFYPSSNMWILINTNWLAGFSVLIVINLGLFLVRSLNKKTDKGNSFLFIPFILFHLYFYFIAFKGISEDAVYIVNTIYVLVIAGSFYYLIRCFKNNFLSYFTLVMTIIYLVTKYFEIIIIYGNDHGADTGLFVIMIFLGIVLIPVSIFLVKILMKYLKGT